MASDRMDEVAQASAQAGVRARTKDPQQQAARRTEALALRLAGTSYDVIAERMGVSRSTVMNMIETSLERAESTGVSNLRAEENARLDRMNMAIWGKVIQGDLKAIAMALNISAQRSKINGLYAPTQVQVSMTIRQEMEEALSALENLVLYETGAVQDTPQGLREVESWDVTGDRARAAEADAGGAVEADR